jgi:hypothetical protein
LLTHFSFGRKVQSGAFAAQPAQIGWVCRIASHTCDLKPFGLNDDTATHATVRASRTRFFHGLQLLKALTRLPA